MATNSAQITTEATQHFLDYAAKLSGVSINVNHDPTQQKKHLHIDIVKPNELTQNVIDLLNDLSELLQFSLDSLTDDHQRLTQLIEAGFVISLLSTLEEHFISLGQSHQLTALYDTKNKLKRLIDEMLKDRQYKELLKDYPDIPTVTELFLASYEVHATMQAQSRPKI